MKNWSTTQIFQNNLSVCSKIIVQLQLIGFLISACWRDVSEGGYCPGITSWKFKKVFFFVQKLGFLWLPWSVFSISSLWPRSVDAWSLLVGGVWVDGYCPGRSHNCSLLGTTWPPHINISKTYLRRITKSRWSSFDKHFNISLDHITNSAMLPRINIYAYQHISEVPWLISC